MRLFSILLISASLSFGAACTLVVSATSLAASAGLWTGLGCTGPTFVPGNGDRATISGATLTIANGETWTIGSSPASGGTGAIVLGTTGMLIVGSGGSVIVRGDIRHGATNTFSQNVAVQVNGGGTLTWDGTQNIGAIYGFTPTSELEWGQFFCNGSAGSHAVVTSNLSGGAKAGSLGLSGGFTFVNSLVLNYCDVSNVGDASTPFAYLEGDPGAGVFVPLTVTHCAITNSGQMGSTAGILGIDLTVQSSIFTGGLGSYDLVTTQLHSGTVTGSVLTLGADFNIWPTNGTISGNYFQRVTELGISDVGPFFDNFIRNDTSTLTIWSLTNPMSGVYFFDDVTAQDNPHFTQGTPNQASIVTNSIFESPDNVTTDTGEAYETTASASSPFNYLLQRSIVLPSKTGLGIAELGAVVMALSNVTNQYFHNSIVSGGGIGTNTALQIDEAGASTSTLVAEANLFYSAGSVNLKLNTQNPSAPSTDTCSPTNCDYNFGYNTALTLAGCTNCTNQGRGYGAKFSATPGAHDADIAKGTFNPYLASMNNRVATWDTIYLKNAVATAWATSTAYAVGALVSVATPGTYGGMPINYRCTTAHTSGATTQPDVGVNWRNDWEYASLADLRTAVLAGTVYIDGSLPECQTACSPVKTLVSWVRRGWTPQNGLLYNYTFPGDTSGIANIGASPMPSPIAVIPVVN